MNYKWLKDLRILQKKTQQETADKAGITRAFYSMIELGIRTPSVENAKKIAGALGFDWTLFYETEPAEELPQEA